MRFVLTEIDGPLAIVTLNRADGANALDLAMGRDLLEAALRVEADPAARAVVVTGAGKHRAFKGVDSDTGANGINRERASTPFFDVGKITRSAHGLVRIQGGTVHVNHLNAAE